MRARDVMTSDVVSVRTDLPARQIAKVLLEHGISAVPVVDDQGAPVGMVSEGDLIPRGDAEREERRDWWLALLAEGEALHPDFLSSLQASDRVARDIMIGPVVTANPDTDVSEIARLLAAYRIKRVPVVANGRIVGIVSRADLLRALATEPPTPAATEAKGPFAHSFFGFNHRPVQARHPEGSAPATAQRTPASDHPAVAEFQRLVTAFKSRQAQRRQEARRAEAEHRKHEVDELLSHHVSDERWHVLLQHAHAVAERGEKEFMLLRFPSQVCSDGGRAINVADAHWPTTLRGEAAEMYLRWERDLKPGGFHLTARVLDFPGGIPGDIGLYVSWR